MHPCWALIGDQDENRKETEKPVAHFCSFITFTGPQSHLRNHGDADKVTHDYSSVAPPDWTAPESFKKKKKKQSVQLVSLLYLSLPPQDGKRGTQFLSVCFSPPASPSTLSSHVFSPIISPNHSFPQLGHPRLSSLTH